jgi:hypothetical protein
MSSALTVQPSRHLALPECCLFAPTELQIGPALSQTEFSRLGKALSSVDQASDLWACDYALAGQKRWGDDGLKLAATATKLSVGYLKTGARIAERFDPARRFPNLTREHYRGICCFPAEFTDKWLPDVAEKGFGAKSLRALAVEAFGSDPKAGYSKNKKRSVSIPETLYARLKEQSSIPKVAVFCEQILEDWSYNATPEMHARVDAALLTREERQHERHMAEKNRKKALALAEKERRRAKREAEKLAEKEELQRFYEAEAAQRAAAKEAVRAAKAKQKAAEHCAKIAKFTERQGKKSQFATQAEADAVISHSPQMESYECACGQYHIRRRESAVGTNHSDGKPSDHAEPRPTYAERRAAQRV